MRSRRPISNASSPSELSCFYKNLYTFIALFGIVNIPTNSNNTWRKRTLLNVNAELPGVLNDLARWADNISSESSDDALRRPLLRSSNAELALENAFNHAKSHINLKLQETYFFHFSQKIVFMIGAIATLLFLINNKVHSFLPLENFWLPVGVYAGAFLMVSSVYISFFRCLTSFKKQIPSAIGALGITSFLANQSYPFAPAPLGSEITNPILYVSIGLTALPFLISFLQCGYRGCKKMQKGKQELIDDKLSTPLKWLYLNQLYARVLSLEKQYVPAGLALNRV